MDLSLCFGKLEHLLFCVFDLIRVHVNESMCFVVEYSIFDGE